MKSHPSVRETKRDALLLCDVLLYFFCAVEARGGRPAVPQCIVGTGAAVQSAAPRSMVSLFTTRSADWLEVEQVVLLD